MGNRKFRLELSTLVGCAVTAFVGVNAANAGVIQSPTAVIENTIGDALGFEIVHAIDQSGLSLAFVSGVTNFDTYLGGNPTHSEPLSSDAWFSPFGPVTGFIDFDFGSSLIISRLALWNEDNAGVSSMRIFTSNDSSFGSSTLVGTFSPANSPGSPVSAQVFDLIDTTAQYVRLEILASHWNDSPDLVGIDEIAFDVSTTTQSGVPEPSSVMLIGTGVAALVTMSRLKRAKR